MYWSAKSSRLLTGAIVAALFVGGCMPAPPAQPIQDIAVPEPRYATTTQSFDVVDVTFRSPLDIRLSDPLGSANIGEIIVRNTSTVPVTVVAEFLLLSREGYRLRYGGDVLSFDRELSRPFPGDEPQLVTGEIVPGGSIIYTAHLYSVLGRLGVMDPATGAPLRDVSNLCPSFDGDINVTYQDASGNPAGGLLLLKFEGPCFAIEEGRDWAKDLASPIVEFRPAYTPLDP